MHLLDMLHEPGDHALLFDGPVGQLETIVSVPNQVRPSQMAIIGHPHSLQGGTMNNKVVTTLVRVFKELGIPAIRFNFRGVGLSAGQYDEGLGESEDMLAIIAAWQQEDPTLLWSFAGFSFGSYVTYRAASQCPHQLLISIAPPVHHYDYQAFQPTPSPWLIIQGEEDEVVPCALVKEFVEKIRPKPELVLYPDTGHFFHGKLIDLKDRLLNSVPTRLQLS